MYEFLIFRFMNSPAETWSPEMLTERQSHSGTHQSISLRLQPPLSLCQLPSRRFHRLYSQGFGTLGQNHLPVIITNHNLSWYLWNEPQGHIEDGRRLGWVCCVIWLEVDPIVGKDQRALDRAGVRAQVAEIFELFFHFLPLEQRQRPGSAQAPRDRRHGFSLAHFWSDTMASRDTEWT